ncbi:phosphoenolpyruvate--protein phosphotransferase [Marinobacterium aestuariivivens]|uniref:phosphoenolpyruvate--protein phosphotransferase n=1 Tax=Marinobacterium aestuariivivens TaxID=1698799 RepID=A0ABW2A9K9_9GAMM
MKKQTKGNDRSKLASLSRVIQQMDGAPDMETALRILVERTRELMSADVCSVYFTEQEKRRHVMVATSGLAPSVIGKVQFGFGKGLIGRVAESAKPINLDSVPTSLNQDFVAQSDAGRYQGFLGAPITHRSRVLGVLVVRQRVARRFNDADIALLTTLAAQLGGTIAYARVSGELCSFCAPDEIELNQLDGVAGAPGIASGVGLVIFPASDLYTVPHRRAQDPDLEERNLRAAIAHVQDELSRLGEDLAGPLSPADRALFDAYALMLNSPEILDTAVQHIRRGNWAPGALRKTIEAYSQAFSEMDDPYLRERSADIRDLGNRILVHLQGTLLTKHDYPANTILIGRQLGAIDLGLVPRERVRGIISTEGSPLSHVIILARALGIPAVVGIEQVPLEHLDGQEVVADGNQGRVYLRPSPRLRAEIERINREERTLEQELERLQDLPSRTQDGVNVPLYTNVGLIEEVALVASSGSGGIGLFRTELPFMLLDRFPSEQEQVKIYRQVLEAVAPLPVNLRTLDVGGDKPLPYLPIAESNPMLGWRGIRLMLDRPEIFLTQLRAALRANVGLENLRLLLPMVNGVTELEQALDLIARAHRQLLEEGIASSRPPTGLMIEVPSAVYQAEELARRVDFLSIGTNDLSQYLLAIDRGNPQVSNRLDPLHPAVLRALRQVVEAAGRTGKPVSVCGEMASNPACALLLVGLGIDSLSVNAAALPRVKWAVRSVDSQHLKSLATEALKLEKPEFVRQLLDTTLEVAGLERLRRQPGSTIAGDKAST